MGDGFVQRPEHFVSKKRAVGSPPGVTAAASRPSYRETLDCMVTAVLDGGWHEAYNLNPEDWDEVAARMLSALEDWWSP